MTQIGVQINATTVNFGGEEPSALEQDGLRQLVDERFAWALERGALGADDRAVADQALRRLFGPRRTWTERDGVCLLGVRAESVAELELPIEWLGRPPTPTPVVVRCELADTQSIPERAHRSEEGRIVLATAGDGLVPASAVQSVMLMTCSRGLLDFDDGRDHLHNPSKAELEQALTGAAVLLLACPMHVDGLSLQASELGERPIDGAALTELLLPFADELRLVVLMPVHAGDPLDDPGRVLVEIAAGLHRAGIAAVVAPRVPIPPEALPEVTRALFETLLGDPDTLPLSLERALAVANSKLAQHDDLAGLRLRLYARSADGDDTRPLVIRPYRGLLAFERQHARFYGGRDEQIDEAVARLDEFVAQGAPRFLLLVGPSGVGKSSLAKAGVMPRLAARGWRPILARPSDGLDLGALACERGPRLLVVDQLEELLISTDAPALAAAAAYLQQLWSLASDGESTIVIATMRIDALESGGALVVGRESGSAPAYSLEKLIQSRHWQYIAHLDSARLASVVADPARQVGLRFDDGLVDRLCTDALAQPGALPMLAVVLDRLWTHRSGGALRANKYEGGLATTMTEHANECIAKLDDDRRVQAKRILVRLAMDPDAKLASGRRRTRVAELRPAHPQRRAAFDDALAALVERRLVVRGDLLRRTDASGVTNLAVVNFDEVLEPTTIEFAHELLLRRWSELVSWIRADRPRLAAINSLVAWVQEHRARGTLLTSDQLGYIDRVLLPEDDDISPQMAELLEASRRQIRKQSWLRRGSVVLAVVVALGFAGLSLELAAERDGAQNARHLAENERHLAEEARRLADHRLDQAIGLTETILGEILPQLGQYPEARKEKKAIIESLQGMLRELGVADPEGETLWQTMVTHNLRGDEALHTDNLAKAREEYAKALTIAESLAKDQRDMRARRDVWVSLNKMGWVELWAGRLDVARRWYQQSLEVQEELAIIDPSSAMVKQDMSASLNGLGTVEREAGNLDVAREYYARALAIDEALADIEPSPAAKRNLYVSLGDLASVDFHSGRLDAARENYVRALAIQEELALADPGNEDTTRDISIFLCQLGDVEIQMGQLEAARGRYQRALKLQEELQSADPSSVQTRRDVAVTLSHLGDADLQLDDFDAARTHYQGALEVAEELSKQDPNNGQFGFDVARGHMRLADLADQADDMPSFKRHLLAADARFIELERHGQLTEHQDRVASRDWVSQQMAEID